MTMIMLMIAMMMLILLMITNMMMLIMLSGIIPRAKDEDASDSSMRLVAQLRKLEERLSDDMREKIEQVMQILLRA